MVEPAKLHQCPDCAFASASPRKLGRHRSVNHGQVKYKCEQCDFVTGYQSNYYRHRKQAHSHQQPSFTCTKCEFTAGTNEGLTVHMSQMHKERYVCEECSAELNTKSQWQEHLRTYHGKSVPTEGVMANDNIANMFWQFLQASAAAMALSSAAMAGQEPTTDEQSGDSSPAAKYARNYVCSAGCGFSTRESRDHLHHLRDVHGEKIQIFYCDKCTYASKFLAKVKRHQTLIHDRPKSTDNSDSRSRPSSAEIEHPTECHYENGNGEDGCSDDDGGKLMIAENPEGQQTTDVEPNSGQVLACELCRYTTTEPARFRKHVRCHQTTAQTSCQHCDFHTVYSWNLDRHVRCHFTPGRFLCNRCTFSQNTRQSMAFHLQHHHKIERISVSTQTDQSWGELEAEGVEPSVTVQTEPFNFERHAIQDNPDYQGSKPVLEASEEVCERVSTPSELGEETKERPKSKNKQHLTLDKMVAERAFSATPEAVVSANQRYLSEHEAIESPSDERDFKEMEDDPDIKTRTCSVCGYQGKWISEMVRHKRVHTNERPFKCRYCNRTSKWKADLIRHVAKVHGVRVVSKYSRSKTFDSDPSVMRAMKEEHGFVADRDAHDDDLYEPLPDRKRPLGTASKESWQCIRCCYEHESKAVVFDHLSNVHNLPPYSCPLCDFSSMYRKTCLCHIQADHPEQKLPAAIENLVCKSGRETGQKRKHDWPEMDAVKKIRSEQQGSVSGASSVSSLTSPDSPSGASGSIPSPASCDQCPFVTDSTALLSSHRKGHEQPKGLFNYKCVFCDWFAKKKQLVFEHLRLHTERPEDHMTDVEKNLITPLAAKNPSSPAKNALQGLQPAEMFRCKLCSFSAPSSAALQTHEQSHEAKQLQPATLSLPVDSDGLKSALLSDFGALLDAVSTEDAGGQATDANGRPTKFGEEETADSDGEMEDRLMYVHAGADVVDAELLFAQHAPVEIDKVTVVVEGEQKKVWQCRYCPHFSKRRANLKMHEKRHFKATPDGQLKCPRCTFRGDKRALNDHYSEHVPDAPMPYRVTCTQCPATFRADADLQTHLAFHSTAEPKEGQFSCSHCNYTVPTLRELHQHMAVHPANGLDLPLTKLKTVEHKRVQNGSSPSLVGAAPDSSPMGSAFWENSITQTAAAPKPKKFGCDKCQAKFSDNTQLKRHTKFHGISLKYSCELCDYSVPFPINLVKHLRAHHTVSEEKMQQMQEGLKKQAAEYREHDRLLKLEAEEQNPTLIPTQKGSLRYKLVLPKNTASPPPKEQNQFHTTPKIGLAEV